jgi:tetratricopeptide (TPR) repeat protein
VNDRYRVVAALFLSGLVLLAGAGCSQSPEAKKQKAVTRGEQYMKEGKVNEAVIEFRNALQIDPNFLPAVQGLGRAYAAKSWNGDAIREFQRAEKLSPNTLSIEADLGRVLVQSGAFKEAEAQASAILSKEPRNIDGLYIRATALLGQGKVQEAKEVLQSVPAGEAPPDISRTTAIALARLGKIAEAEQTFLALLAKDPKDGLSLAGLGAIELSRGHSAEALALYERAKAVLPADPRMRQGLAVAHARLGQLPEAIKELEQVDQRAWSADTVLALSTYYLRANRPADAIRLLAPVVERAPRFPSARYLLGLAYLASNDPGPAITQFEELQRQAPDNIQTRFRLGVAYSRAGRPKEALAQMDSVARAMDRTTEYQL